MNSSVTHPSFFYITREIKNVGGVVFLKTLQSVRLCQGAVKVNCSSRGGELGARGDSKSSKDRDLTASEQSLTVPEQEEQSRFGEGNQVQPAAQ